MKKLIIIWLVLLTTWNIYNYYRQAQIDTDQNQALIIDWQAINHQTLEIPLN